MPSLFHLGKVVATPAALDVLQSCGVSPAVLLARHAAGDCGDLCPEDRAQNDRALQDGGRLLSAYVVAAGVTVWVITDAADDDGRSFSTCILLPSDY